MKISEEKRSVEERNERMKIKLNEEKRMKIREEKNNCERKMKEWK